MASGLLEMSSDLEVKDLKEKVLHLVLHCDSMMEEGEGMLWMVKGLVMG
jgi:hypothetical protein